MEVLFGQDVHDAEVARIAAAVPTNGNGEYRSEALCRAQIASSVLAANIVQTIYGYSLRYASGIQNFGIIARFPHGEAGLPEAIDYSRTWQAHDPSHRVVYRAY